MITFLYVHQTTHIWGNLFSSFLLGQQQEIVHRQWRLEVAGLLHMDPANNNESEYIDDIIKQDVPGNQCGVLYQCKGATDVFRVFPDKHYGKIDLSVIAVVNTCIYSESETMN